MSRCVSLLLQVLRATNDNKTLIELALQLRKTPDPDKYSINQLELTEYFILIFFLKNLHKRLRTFTIL